MKQNLAKFMADQQAALIELLQAFSKAQNIEGLSDDKAVWTAVLDGVTDTFTKVMDVHGDIPPLMVGLPEDDQITAFARQQALRHHTRGGQMVVLIAMAKHLRTSLIELIRQNNEEMCDKIENMDRLRRFFDRLEVAYCSEWANMLQQETTESLLAVTTQLESKNNQLMREHNELQALVNKLEGFQSQLLQSEKMASVGQLAAGVAHEINNPIAYVYSNLGTLDKYLGEIFALIEKYTSQEDRMTCLGEELEKIHSYREEIDFDFLREDTLSLLRESREGLDRVKKIILDLKDFSRAGQDDKWEQANLHTGLESTLNVVWNELKYKCEIKKEFSDIPFITCLPQQLNQVFMNLMVNAAHAIETRGVITLRTGTEGNHVWVEVEDTGRGIPPENLPKIFDPFFTTTPVGKGTGLGLSVSYSIVEKHHGRIEVSSEVGKGSTFRVTLPIEQPEDTPQ